MNMSFSQYKELVFSDLFRVKGKANFVELVTQLLLGRSFKYAFWMRSCQYTHRKPLLHYTVHFVCRVILRHYRYRFGIDIPFETQIGHGFYIGHFNGIVVNDEAVIGDNCNISNGVTIGQVNRGARKGCPVLGNNVYIAPGAKIVGAIKIGNNVAIGANAVVTTDLPDNSVAAGVPARVISDEGSEGYINLTGYTKTFTVTGR